MSQEGVCYVREQEGYVVNGARDKKRVYEVEIVKVAKKRGVSAGEESWGRLNRIVMSPRVSFRVSLGQFS